MQRATIRGLTGARSLDGAFQSLRQNLQAFKIPHAGIEAIRSKLAMEILDEYANIRRPVFEREAALSALRNMILKNDSFKSIM